MDQPKSRFLISLRRDGESESPWLVGQSLFGALRARGTAMAMLTLAAWGIAVGAEGGQPQTDPSKPTVPLVSVVGCARRTPEGAWTLINATAGAETRTLFMTAKEVDEARKRPAGNNRYTLLGTPEFLSKEELLKSGQRSEFTRPDVANGTGQLQDGRRIFVKGLLITAPNERRLNLVAVQQLAESCK
jgi:hypothetical protein